MRTVFIGTSEFAAGVLRRLAESPHRPALVLSRPDRRQGRGRRMAAPPVAEAARALRIELSQPERVGEPESVERIEGAGAEVIVVCAFGALIREPLLSLRMMLNIHPSLLPRWRGAAPIERAIMAGDEVTGVSIMRLTEGLDSGPLCLSASEPIAPEDDYGSLAARLREIGGELIVQALDRIERGPPAPFAEQEEGQATYAEKIGPEDRILDPARDAQTLARTVRALHPHIGARLITPDGSALGVMRARALAAAGGPRRPDRAGPVPEEVPPGGGEASEPAGSASLPPPGELAQVDGRLLLGAAGGGALELIEVRPPGGRAMDARAYLRGHAL